MKQIVRVPFHVSPNEFIHKEMATQGFDTISMKRLPEDMMEPGLKFEVEVEPIKKSEPEPEAAPRFPPPEELSKRIDDALATLQMAKLLQGTSATSSVSLMAFIRSAIQDLQGTKKWETL